MLFISPLLLVLIVSVMTKTHNDIESIKVSLIAALAGLLLGMLIVGKKIFEPASKINTCQVK
jgi:phosphate/sulfate permease